MSLYAIGDTHLSFGCDKPMDVFDGWFDYVSRLSSEWNKNILNSDTVVLVGDFSWAMNIDEALEDFKFIDSLPGKKILVKGNHDYWWGSLKKMREKLKSNSIETVDFLHNNFFTYDDIAICGTRGWITPDNDADLKVYNRELNRLKLSLDLARQSGHERIFSFIHYPPIYLNYRQEEFIELLKQYNVERCYYGHVHGKSINFSVNTVVEDIKFRLVSADYLNFSPLFIY
ncbi:MAG: serine/threonine protein phosphatase [Ruminococcaceae bacterium]|nr:serine/threonine protein phosphatase [Oscillospiraceae bacterium]